MTWYYSVIIIDIIDDVRWLLCIVILLDPGITYPTIVFIVCHYWPIVGYCVQLMMIIMTWYGIRIVMIFVLLLTSIPSVCVKIIIIEGGGNDWVFIRTWLSVMVLCGLYSMYCVAVWLTLLKFNISWLFVDMTCPDRPTVIYNLTGDLMAWHLLWLWRTSCRYLLTVLAATVFGIGRNWRLFIIIIEMTWRTMPDVVHC